MEIRVNPTPYAGRQQWASSPAEQAHKRRYALDSSIISIASTTTLQLCFQPIHYHPSKPQLKSTTPKESFSLSPKSSCPAHSQARLSSSLAVARASAQPPFPSSPSMAPTSLSTTPQMPPPLKSSSSILAKTVPSPSKPTQAASPTSSAWSPRP